MLQGTITSAPGPIRWFKPESWLGKLTLWTAGIVLSSTLLRLLLGHHGLGIFFGSILGFGWPLFALFAMTLLVRTINRRLLWKVRNRLIVTYVLLGLAPIILFGTLSAIVGYIFAGQFSINSALEGINGASEQLKTEASSLADLLTQPEWHGSLKPLHFEQGSNPRERQISAAVLRDGAWHTVSMNTDRGPSPNSPFDGQTRPAWQGTGWHGIVVSAGKLYLCRVAGATEGNRNAQVLTALEFNKETLSSVGNALGRILVFSGSVANQRVEIDDAEHEAQAAEKDADLADAQREAQQQLRESQRDAQEELRDTQRDQQQAERDAAGAVQQAQVRLNRAQAEVARAVSNPDDRDSAQESIQEAQKSLQEAEQQAARTPPASTLTPTLPASARPPITKTSPALNLSPSSTPRTRDTTRGLAAKSGSVHHDPVDLDDDSFSAVSGGSIPTLKHFFDQRVYFSAPLAVFKWSDGRQRPALLVVISRPSALYTRLFSSSVEMGSILRNVMIAIAIGFGFIELFALWMALRLSGTITRSVADLYRGTTEIDKGNLDYRVTAQRADQLGALAGSFNRMAGSIKDLLVQQREKDRLLNELAIAQEVQQNLFPHSPVLIAGLELHAICVPARSVSGDYFDFIVGHNTLSRGTGACIALGDISGKGMSAALLMATLHSAVRAFGLRENAGLPSPAEQLALLNKHLFTSTQSNRYATLFLAFYDARTRLLTYSNGGHLPPFLISVDGGVQRLTVGGPVVGLLEGLSYQEATVELRPGDLLAAFTDGMTEPENAAEQEFGEGRLLSLLNQGSATPLTKLADTAFAALKQWIADQEQPDDMTLLLARQN